MLADYEATPTDPDRRTFESGQIVIDKWRSWRPLLLSLYIVLRSDAYAKPMFDLFGYGADGDKGEALPSYHRSVFVFG